MKNFNMFPKEKFLDVIAYYLNWIASLNVGKQFLVFIFFPCLVLGFYLLFISPDRYVSEAKVMVKDSGVRQLENGFFEGLGFNSAESMKDEQLLQAYLGSPNMLESLEEEMNLKEHYSQTNDFIFGLSLDDSFEKYLDFYRRHISVKPNANTGLLEIRVEAYSPDFSKSLADKLLIRSENFINESGQSIAKLEMKFADDEISLAQERLKRAKQALINFQNQYALVSPESDGESLFTIIFSLEDELAKTEAKIHQAKSFLNINSPQLNLLINESEALRKEISIQKKRVTGNSDGDDKLNELNAVYQSLVLDVEMATTLYTSSLSAYELSRVQAAKQLKFLVIASKPHLSDEPLYPKRLYWFITYLILMLMIWLIYRLVIASISEHRD